MFGNISILMILITSCIYSQATFCETPHSDVENGYHLVIRDMPQELQDFFETADSCELWMGFFDRRLDKVTLNYIEGRVKEVCMDFKSGFNVMKSKYKSNKGYSARLTVYDDTLLLYKDYVKKSKAQFSSQ